MACNDGVGTTENHYWRAFDMNTFTGGQEYDVTSVSFGIELAQSGAGTGQPLTVNLYANNGSPFPGGDWQSNMIATSGELNIPDQADTIFEVPITATVPAGTLELVMEVMTPDGTAVGNLLFIGSNTDPETGPSYLSAADCGVNDPTPTGDLGFPDMHIVMNVNGSCGSTTPTPTATGTPSPTPTPTCPVTYTTATSTGTITPGGTDIGNHCDDCFTQIDLPFPVNVYGAPTSVAWPASNGDLHLADPTLKSFYYMQCVPVDPSPDGPWTNTLFPFYDDMLTMDGPFQTCSDCGIFTQTVGTAPNRQFIIRWKTVYFNNAGNAEFEVILTEGSDTLSVIYGDTSGDNGLTAASGIQQDLNVFTSFSCFGDVPLTSGLRVDYIPAGCGSPTPTPTATATTTPTATATATATPYADSYCGTASNSVTAAAANTGASPVAVSRKALVRELASEPREFPRLLARQQSGSAVYRSFSCGAQAAGSCQRVATRRSTLDANR